MDELLRLISEYTENTTTENNNNQILAAKILLAKTIKTSDPSV